MPEGSASHCSAIYKTLEQLSLLVIESLLKSVSPITCIRAEFEGLRLFHIPADFFDDRFIMLRTSLVAKITELLETMSLSS